MQDLLFQGHVYAKNWIINENRFPSIIPVGEYRAQTYMYTKKNLNELIIYKSIYSAKFVSKK